MERKSSSSSYKNYLETMAQKLFKNWFFLDSYFRLLMLIFQSVPLTDFWKVGNTSMLNYPNSKEKNEREQKKITIKEEGGKKKEGRKAGK